MHKPVRKTPCLFIILLLVATPLSAQLPSRTHIKNAYLSPASKVLLLQRLDDIDSIALNNQWREKNGLLPRSDSQARQALINALNSLPPQEQTQLQALIPKKHVKNKVQASLHAAENMKKEASTNLQKHQTTIADLEKQKIKVPIPPSSVVSGAATATATATATPGTGTDAADITNAANEAANAANVAADFVKENPDNPTAVAAANAARFVADLASYLVADSNDASVTANNAVVAVALDKIAVAAAALAENPDNPATVAAFADTVKSSVDIIAKPSSSLATDLVNKLKESSSSSPALKKALENIKAPPSIFDSGSDSYIPNNDDSTRSTTSFRKLLTELREKDEINQPDYQKLATAFATKANILTKEINDIITKGRKKIKDAEEKKDKGTKEELKQTLTQTLTTTLEQKGILLREQQLNSLVEGGSFGIGRIGTAVVVPLVDGEGVVQDKNGKGTLTIVGGVNNGVVAVQSAKAVVNNRVVASLDKKTFSTVSDALGEHVDEAPSIAANLRRRGADLAQLKKEIGSLWAGRKGDLQVQFTEHKSITGGESQTFVQTTDLAGRTTVYDPQGNVVGRVKVSKDKQIEGFMLSNDGKKIVKVTRQKNGGFETENEGLQAVKTTDGRLLAVVPGTKYAVGFENGKQVFFDATGEKITNKNKLAEAEKAVGDALNTKDEKSALFDQFLRESVKGERGLSEVFADVRRTVGTGFLAGKILKKYEQYSGLAQLGSFFVGDEKIQARKEALADAFCLFGGLTKCIKSVMCDLPNDNVEGKDVLFTLTPSGDVKSVSWISASRGQVFLDYEDDSGFAVPKAVYVVEYGVTNALDTVLGYNIDFYPEATNANQNKVSWYVQDRQLQSSKSEQFSGTSSLKKATPNDYAQVCIRFNQGIKRQDGSKVHRQCTPITSYDGPPEAFIPESQKAVQGQNVQGNTLIPSFGGPGNNAVSTPSLTDGGAI